MKLISTSVGQGPHLVLLHGWGLNSGVWHAIVDLLAPFYRVTTIDLPGFGVNQAQMPDSYSLENLAKGIESIMPEQAILLGWSLGGLVAQQIAFRSPQKVSQLILLATSPCFIAQAQWPGIKIPILANFKQQLLENAGATISRFLAIQAMGSPSAKQDVKLIKQYIDSYPLANPLALSAGLELLASSDLRLEFSALNMPCYVLLGRLDSLVPVKLKDCINQLNPAVQVRVFDHSSHAPFISQPACFVQFLLARINKDAFIKG